MSSGDSGNQIDVQTGEWQGLLSGLGAGLDSFYEYLLKTYILFGDYEDFQMFNQSYSVIKEHLRRGSVILKKCHKSPKRARPLPDGISVFFSRQHCNEGWGEHPIYVNVHMKDGTTVNTWIDSLQASFTGVQILIGDLEEAICQHALYYSIWKKYGVLPERFNWQLRCAGELH